MAETPRPRLFDTAARAPRELEITGGRVRMYVCGITPYDSAHLGHAFTYHTFDVLARRLRAAGVAVQHVRNVTDCDDDIFRVARERGIPHRQLVDEQVTRFDRAMRSIDILPVDAAPLASEHVPRMVEWVGRLVDVGAAYVNDGWVYFDVRSDGAYGALSRLPRETMLQLGRSRGADPDDPRKRDPLDFVLWQPSLEDELCWESPFGAPGRPGWHIECTVLSHDLLDGSVDVHGGGSDLVFPHHECELAQANAAGATGLVRHWVHVAMVQLDNQKMSKSLGNLVFVEDLLRTAPAAAVRLMLAAHRHRTDWSYRADELEQARVRVTAWRAALHGHARVAADAAVALQSRFWERLDDDLDTPGALRCLDELAAEAGHEGGEVALADVLPPLAAVLGAESL